MTAVFPAQASFSKGEISPLLASRADIDFWRSSLAECLNFRVLTHGGIQRRSGTRFIAEVRDSSRRCRVLPFKFSESQSYVLVFNGDYVRFLSERGVVGAPYEITHPFADADLSRVSYTQFNDVAYFAHRGYAPRTLNRAGDTSWSFTQQVFKDGPYLSPDPMGTTLTPAEYGSPIPVMTSLTTPSGTVSSGSGAAGAWQIFDLDPSTSVVFTGTSGYVAYEFASGSRVVDAYWVQAGSTFVETVPANWEFQGYDGSIWVTLDARTGEVGWVGGEKRFYTFINENAYSGYRLRWTGTSTGVGNTVFANMWMHEKAEAQTPFNLVASNTTGINEGAGFKTTDVGRHARLLGGDGEWRWARIVSRVSSTVVMIRLYGQALGDLNPVSQWRLGSWSADTGYPGSVELFNERLTYARTDRQPVTLWGSKQGEFDDFGISSPVLETDGVEVTLLSSNMNEIIGLSADEDLITLSAGQIRSVGPSDITKSFSATNVSQKKGPTSGAEPIQPLSIGGVTLYVGAGGKKIRELVLGEQNRYIAPELSLIGEHFLKTGIREWAFSEKPDPTIYAATKDGMVIAITYDREQRVIGFAKHDFGGEVESLAVIPGVEDGYDDLYMVVKRTVNGQQKRYIEVLERPFDSASDDIEDAFIVDCGLSYSGAPISTITGLGHLEGATVSVLADGGVIRELVVSGGQVTLRYAASKISVGLSFKGRAVTLPVAGPGRDGSLFGRRRNVTGVYVDCYGTGALRVGALGFDLSELSLHDGDSLFGSAVSLKTGFYPVEIEGSWAESNGQVVMETEDPLPALVRSLVLQLESEP